MIVGTEMITREFLNLANLSGAQTLHVHKPVKVDVVGEYKHLILRPFKVVFPSLEGLNNG